jgi:DNA polymerase-3 subunit delta'
MMTFDDILDQKPAIDWLRRAYEADRLPHGLIFSGPAGVGKGTTANALAGLFLCENPKGNRACGKCQSCKIIDAGTHPDFHVITRLRVRELPRLEDSKAISVGIEVVKEFLVKPAGLKNSMGRGKVFLIEQADLMTAAAQNGLLKTLEEPAGRTLIILLTDNSDALLPTVRSRCQLVRFSYLPVEVVRKELEKRGISKPQTAAAAKLSGGSIGIALKWIEQGVIDNAINLLDQLDQLIAGRTSQGLAEVIRKSAEAYAEWQMKSDKLSSKPQAMRDGFALYLHIASEHFRKLMESGDDFAQMDRAANAIDAIHRAEQYLDSNVTVALVFQQLTLALEKAWASKDGLSP